MRTSGWLLILACCGLMAATGAHGEKVRKRDLPEAVLKAFIGRYPKAKVKAYLREERDGKVYYELQARNEGVTKTVVMSPDGAILEVRELLTKKSLPFRVSRALAAQHPDGTIRRAEKIMRGPETKFKVSVKVGKRVKDLFFDRDGTAL